MPAPSAFDIVWGSAQPGHPLGPDTVTLYRGALTPALREADKACPWFLVRAGLSTHGGVEARFYEAEGHDWAKTQENIALAVEAVAAARAEAARREEMRLAYVAWQREAERAWCREFAAEAVPDLRWAFTDSSVYAAVEEVVARGEWTDADYEAVSDALHSASGIAGSARERVRKPFRKWMERAADRAVQAAALEACRLLSGLDEDWASEANGVGWSQSTTYNGHALAGQDELDQAHASQALRALHGHRRQLPRELRLRLFGDLA